MTEQEKKETIERLILELIEESRGSDIDIGIGKGHFTVSKYGDWYTSNGECYPRHQPKLGKNCDCGCNEEW